MFSTKSERSSQGRRRNAVVREPRARMEGCHRDDWLAADVVRDAARDLSCSLKKEGFPSGTRGSGWLLFLRRAGRETASSLDQAETCVPSRPEQLRRCDAALSQAACWLGGFERDGRSCRDPGRRGRGVFLERRAEE